MHTYTLSYVSSRGKLLERLKNMARHPKFRIYKDIICLETDSPEGGRYWDLGRGLVFRSYHVSQITRVRHGILSGTSREVLAAHVEGQWVAINLPRSDIPSLQERGLMPSDMLLPYDEVEKYTPRPGENDDNSGNYV